MEFINFELFSFGGETGRRAGFKIQFLLECGFDSHPKYFFFNRFKTSADLYSNI